MANIMIVDDALFMRMSIKQMITELGHEVVAEGSNGLEAIEKYSEVKPDLITMDITMPEMDGIAAVKEIMKINPNAKIIMCSAMGQKQMVAEAIQAGAKDFIVKPFQKDRVLAAIRNALA